jgi:hypothetical protein
MLEALLKKRLEELKALKEQMDSAIFRDPESQDIYSTICDKIEEFEDILSQYEASKNAVIMDSCDICEAKIEAGYSLCNKCADECEGWDEEKDAYYMKDGRVYKFNSGSGVYQYRGYVK